MTRHLIFLLALLLLFYFQMTPPLPTTSSSLAHRRRPGIRDARHSAMSPIYRSPGLQRSPRPQPERATVFFGITALIPTGGGAAAASGSPRNAESSSTPYTWPLKQRESTGVTYSRALPQSTGSSMLFKFGLQSSNAHSNNSYLETLLVSQHLKQLSYLMHEHWHSKGGGTANVQQQQQQRSRLHLRPRILVPETSSSLPLLKQLRMHVVVACVRMFGNSIDGLADLPCFIPCIATLRDRLVATDSTSRDTTTYGDESNTEDAFQAALATYTKAGNKTATMRRLWNNAYEIAKMAAENNLAAKAATATEVVTGNERMRLEQAKQRGGSRDWLRAWSWDEKRRHADSRIADILRVETSFTTTEIFTSTYRPFGLGATQRDPPDWSYIVAWSLGLVMDELWPPIAHPETLPQHSRGQQERRRREAAAQQQQPPKQEPENRQRRPRRPVPAPQEGQQPNPRTLAQQTRRQRKRQQRENIRDLPLARRPYMEPEQRHDLGCMDVECRYCHALHWLAEKTAASTARAPEFGTFCNHGKVDLPILQKPPDALYQLFVRNDT
ncbi:hypothetical protein C8J57DRAFT_1233744 [Mycena rebaudengoi]|nr:hypothetical protein C8J57DRAFT_1233744 [Mycena rebaudengoi]